MVDHLKFQLPISKRIRARKYLSLKNLRLPVRLTAGI
jgi:hypothetical protein